MIKKNKKQLSNELYVKTDENINWVHLVVCQLYLDVLSILISLQFLRKCHRFISEMYHVNLRVFLGPFYGEFLVVANGFVPIEV